jgi:stage II sporulation protein D
MTTLKALFLLAGILMSTLLAWSAEFRLGLYNAKEIRACVFSVTEGEYVLIGNGKQIGVAQQGNMFHIALSGANLDVRDTTQFYGVFQSLTFKGVSGDNAFLIRPVNPTLEAKESDDDLQLTGNDFTIFLVNILSLEKYLAGTVESEGGPGAGLEFYKAQAILARTYAVKNFTRHALQGFNLCDDVHCQAYKGKSRHPLIHEATLATTGLILSTPDSDAVTIAYHGNCGGVTSSASMAWNNDLPYMVSIHDPFCTGSTQHEWTRSLPSAEWNSYLVKKNLAGTLPTDFILAGHTRQKYTGPSNAQIALATIRQDLKLKSAFFTLQPVNDQIVIHGYGYGHGVGLCQDGAMQMARVGYNYVDILMFYFRGLTIIKRP